mgnify:CR=1 FL=1
MTFNEWFDRYLKGNQQYTLETAFKAGWDAKDASSIKEIEAYKQQIKELREVLMRG